MGEKWSTGRGGALGEGALGGYRSVGRGASISRLHKKDQLVFPLPNAQSLPALLPPNMLHAQPLLIAPTQANYMA